jgi:hypothetical protein
MTTTKTNRKNYTTPAGEIKFANIQKPSTKFNADGVFDLQLVMTKEAAAPFIKQIEEWTAEAKAALIKEDPKVKTFKPYLPYQDDADAEGNETGLIVFRFKQLATFKDKKTEEIRNVTIHCFDAKGKPISDDVRIGRGSTVKASFRPRHIKITTAKQFGIQLSLQAVQVLNLVEFAARDAKNFGFGQEDGYAAETPLETASSNGDSDDTGGDL